MPHDEATGARAKSFESGAEAYDEFRPGYPDELLDDVLDYAPAQLAEGVLEVGARTSQATIPRNKPWLPVSGQTCWARRTSTVSRMRSRLAAACGMRSSAPTRGAGT